jgi:selenocysteine lyase/cysteine desulfurase
MFVYADNAATTRIDPDVLQAMMPALQDLYGNPSTIYSKGREAHEALDRAREQVAKAINCRPNEVYFTSCGTESDNWAIRGIARHYASKKGKHIITTNIEHHAVLETLKAMEKEGYEVTFLPVNEEGFVTAEQVEQAIRPDTVLITVMTANNEIGSIQPIEEIVKVAKAHNVFVHTDAVQAVGHIAVDVNADNVDMLSLSAHKFHGPKGVGVLYCKKTLPLSMDRYSFSSSLPSSVKISSAVMYLPPLPESFFKIFSFTLKAYGADRVFSCEKEFFIVFKASSDNRNLCRRGIMLIFHAGRLRLFAVLQFFINRRRDIEFAENVNKLVGSYSAGSEKSGRVGNEGHNR